MDASLRRPEIDNGHVPLAFLLGRRAHEYSLPSLAAARRAQPREPPKAPPLPDDNAHLRRREAHARQLLERVLAGESRLNTNQKYEPETPLEAPMARVSTADRRRRAAELQRVLKEREAVANALAAATSGESSLASTAFCTSEEDERRRSKEMYDQREVFAVTHGFAPREPGFVEVVGSVARIRRAQSVRQFHEDEKLEQNKQFRRKQTRRAAMAQQLHAQQTEMKAKLLQVERAMSGMDLDAEDHEKLQGARVGDAVRLKQHAVKQWQDEQHRQLERTKEDEKQQLRQRQELARRAREETTYAVKARVGSSWFEKHTMAKIKGVGPSFQATLRIESPGSPSPSNVTANCPLLLLDGAKQGRFVQEDGEEGEGDADVDRVGGRLGARQYELFQKSQLRSMHLGGGFASKPRGLPHREGDERRSVERDREENHDIAARANAVPLTKVHDEWRQTLAAHPR